MKKIINMHKYLIGVIIGIILVSTISVFAIEGVKAVINSEEVTYDNEKSHGSYKNVQGSIDELYRRSGIMKTKWVDPILNGADPVFDDAKELIPVTVEDNGTVHYANLYTKWYEYETKRWANAVILNSTGKGKNYKTGDKIDEDDIESYFVWIPRYKYKIWNFGNYDKVYIMGNLTDTKEGATNDETSLRNITGKARLIDIEFGDATKISKMQESQANVGEYYTHPAFTLGEKSLNGLWVGKFEVTGDINNITVKPGLQSIRNQTVGTFWHNLYDYKRSLDSHMIKNTEWGAIAYLSHSIYGIGTEVNINNNSAYLTGYSAAANTDQSSFPGEEGTTEEKDKTQPWNTSTGYLASTTGNITGVYDMSGGAWDYMAAYVENYGVHSSTNNYSGFTDDDLSKYSQYFNKYSSSSSSATTYNSRILGDATGEMGPFYFYFDKDGFQKYHNAWYADQSDFVSSRHPWSVRGGRFSGGILAGQFDFDIYDGGAYGTVGTRLILAI